MTQTITITTDNRSEVERTLWSAGLWTEARQVAAQITMQEIDEFLANARQQMNATH